MKLLIDTHVLLWYMNGDIRIKEETLNLIENATNKLFISNASLWEVSIKLSIGKLELNGTLSDLEDYLSEKGFSILEFDVADLEMLQTLPFYHQDPFDRLIIAQSKAKNIKLISYDSKVIQYME